LTRYLTETENLIEGVLKVNSFPHQMAITLAEKGLSDKNQKS
jgi:hypothetical protein